MFKLIDRLMIQGYFKAYFVCFVSLLSLYVVVDLFTNLDDFSGGTFLSVVERIGIYYSYQLTKIFDRLCEAIVLLSAMFTVAWMQRNNEQIPLLAAGISTQRIMMPVIGCACFMLFLTLLNQEVLIPRIADKLHNQRNDPEGKAEILAQAAYEPNGIHIVGRTAIRQDATVRDFEVLIPEKLAGRQIHLTAKEARYIAKDDRHGTWEMINVVPAEEEGWDTNILERIDKGRYLLHIRDVDFEALTRRRKWYNNASTIQLYHQLQKPDERTRQAAVAVLFHMRLTRPLLGVLLVLMGVSIILRDQNRNVILSAGGCLVLCGLFFAVIFCCQQLGERNFVGPVLAAWLPVIVFGPFSFVLFDAVHT